MKWACPNCGRLCGGMAGACPTCGFPLTVGAVTRHYGRRLRHWLSEVTALECPRCRQATPITRAQCVVCGAPLTVQAAVDATLAPPRRGWARFKARSSPATWSRLRWGHLLLSAGVLWGLLAYLEKLPLKAWVMLAGVSVVYLAVFAFLSAWLVPRHVFFALSRASPVVKLAFILNYLSLVLVLQAFIGTWWVRALVLAGLFLATWLGAYLLWRYIMPVAAATEQVFLGPHNRFDASAPHGRDARYD